jgi:hypothetical protein
MAKSGVFGIPGLPLIQSESIARERNPTSPQTFAGLNKAARDAGKLRPEGEDCFVKDGHNCNSDLQTRANS